MSQRSGSDFSAGLTTQNMNLHKPIPRCKTWCYNVVIAKILAIGDPELMDAMFEDVPKRKRKAGKQGRPKKPLGGDLSELDLAELERSLSELERTDPDVAAAKASYDRMIEDLTRTTPKARFPRETT